MDMEMEMGMIDDFLLSSLRYVDMDGSFLTRRIA
jgi:hypothetical protein